MTRLVAGLVLVTVALAGCLSAPSEPADVDDARDRIENATDLLAPKHNHSNGSLHARSTGVEQVAYSTVVDDPSECNVLEVTVQGDYAYTALTCGSTSGFGIVDVSDREDPKLVSEYMTPTPYVWDVKVDADGETAFVGIQGTPGLAYGVPVPPDGEQGVPTSGVQAVDISEKTDPTFLASYPVYKGGHNVEYAEIDGRDVVAVTVTNVVTGVPGATGLPVLAEDPVQTRVALLEFRDGGPLGPGFEHLADYRYVPEEPVRPRGEDAWYQTAHFPHDMTIKQHPETGDALMYVAYWDAGARVVDVSDPANPTELGAWTGFDGEQAGNIHYVEAFAEPIDGRVYAVASPEFAPEDHDGLVHILDVTDPTNPEKVGSWTYPEDVVDGVDDPGYLIFSAHNSDVEDGRIYQGAYHAGTWVLDIAEQGTPEDPKAVGVYAPVPPGDLDEELGGRHPNVWGTDYEDGTMWVSDIPTGLYGVEVTG